MVSYKFCNFDIKALCRNVINKDECSEYIRINTVCYHFSGGVYTTASAFRNSMLIERLQKHNIKFEVVEQGDM